MLKNEFLAYDPRHHDVETVMRLQAVKRWHMIETTRIQTLAEHSANVALLAMMVARTAPINWFDDSTAICAAALIHDTEEAFTGDIPSHTKKKLNGLEELEKTVRHPAFDITVNDVSKMLIKYCDLADGIRFIRVHGVDTTAVHAMQGLEQQFKKLYSRMFAEWPEHVRKHVHDKVSFYAYEHS